MEKKKTKQNDAESFQSWGKEKYLINRKCQFK